MRCAVVGCYLLVTKLKFYLCSVAIYLISIYLFFLLGFCRWCGHFGQGILLNGVCLDLWRLLCLKDKLLLWKKKKIPIFSSQVSSRPDDLSSRHPRLLVQLPEVQKDDWPFCFTLSSTFRPSASDMASDSAWLLVGENRWAAFWRSRCLPQHKITWKQSAESCCYTFAGEGGSVRSQDEGTRWCGQNRSLLEKPVVPDEGFEAFFWDPWQGVLNVVHGRTDSVGDVFG